MKKPLLLPLFVVAYLVTAAVVTTASEPTLTNISTRAFVQTGDNVVIGVRDHGPGIAHEERTRVFDKYYRGSTGSAARGTGLGLAIAREIARAHGGEVWLEASSPEGSEFCLSLPFAPAEASS